MPTSGVTGLGRHHAEVEGVEVGEDCEAVAPVVDRVLDPVLARSHAPCRFAGRAGIDQPPFARDATVGSDQDPATGSARTEADVEPLVGLGADADVLCGRGAYLVAPHLPGAHGLVGHHVEQMAVIGRPCDTCRDGAGDLVGEVLPAAEVAHTQGALLAAVEIGRPCDEASVVRDLEGAEREEVVSLGLAVLVENDRIPGTVGRRAAGVDRVRQTLPCCRCVPPSAVLHRWGRVVLDDTRDDLVVDRAHECGVLGEELLGPRVFCREVGEGLGPRGLPEPHPRVLDGSECALPDVWLAGRGGNGGDVRHRVRLGGSPEPTGCTLLHVRVWIDQDLCTGDGLCVDHCPDVFVQLEDGIAYVAELGVILNDPGGSGSLADVPDRHLQSVVEAADVCPGECIFIEMDATVHAEQLPLFA